MCSARFELGLVNLLISSKRFLTKPVDLRPEATVQTCFFSEPPVSSSLCRTLEHDAHKVFAHESTYRLGIPMGSLSYLFLVLDGISLLWHVG
jgi:hypothetical protein